MFKLGLFTTRASSSSLRMSFELSWVPRYWRLIIQVAWGNSGTLNCVKVHGPYSSSKDALREEGCPWLIKCSGHVSLGDVWHFNTPPHVWQLCPKTCSTSGGKGPSSSKEPALIPCKSLWALLTLKRRLERWGDTMTYKVPRWRKS
jgi:hypothetical protein